MIADVHGRFCGVLIFDVKKKRLWKRKKMRLQEVENHLIGFASRILDLEESMPGTQAAKHLGGQLTILIPDSEVIEAKL